MDTQRNWLSDEVVKDPYPHLQELRNNDPVHWNARHRAWFITTYDEVVSAFANPGLTSDRVTSYVKSKISEEDKARLGRTFDLIGGWMVFRDPPVHTRLRNIVNQAFSPRRIQQLRERTTQIARELILPIAERIESGETVDLIEDYYGVVPARVVGEIFGVPYSDSPQLKHWGDELGQFINGDTTDPNRNERAHAAIIDFEKWLFGLVEGYRSHPADNLLSELGRAVIEGDRLTDSELVSMCMLILDAAYKTTQNALGNATLAMLTDDRVYRELRENRQLLPKATDEFLRFAPPAMMTVRRAREDLTIGGKQVKANDRVFLYVGSANRDAKHFDRPDEIDFTRKIIDHVTFGRGIHFCLGSVLARMEISVCLTEVLDLPKLSLAIDPSELSWLRLLLMRGIRQLPVRKAVLVTETA